jgi:hypothetical protein
MSPPHTPIAYGDKQMTRRPSSVTFDTSGSVIMPLGIDQGPVSRAFWRWPDLSPFCQEFVEAAFASLSADAPELFDAPPSRDGWAEATSRPLGFSDLHPATLARFMEDCEEAVKSMTPTRLGGNVFWRIRSGAYIGAPSLYEPIQERFPPLRLYLSPDGKVMAEAAHEGNAK